MSKYECYCPLCKIPIFSFESDEEHATTHRREFPQFYEYIFDELGGLYYHRNCIHWNASLFLRLTEEELQGPTPMDAFVDFSEQGFPPQLDTERYELLCRLFILCGFDSVREPLDKNVCFLLTRRQIEHGSEDWKRVRSDYISSTDIDKAISSYKNSKFESFLQEKRRTGNHGFWNSEHALPLPMKHGLLYEKFIDFYHMTRHLDFYIFKPGILKHPHCPGTTGTPDGIGNLFEICEDKCPGKIDMTLWEVPTKYSSQVCMYLSMFRDHTNTLFYTECNFPAFSNYCQYKTLQRSKHSKIYVKWELEKFEYLKRVGELFINSRNPCSN